MSTHNIVQKDTRDGEVLRKVAKEVSIKEISSAKIQNLIESMFNSLRGVSDGVALAAPQVGESIRLFVVSPKIFQDNSIDKAQLVYFNPKIIKKSRDRKLMEEGCLSVRWWYGKIRRSSRVTIQAMDANGNEFKIEASGLLAQIFQHETEHLEGILFVDNATELKEMEPPHKHE